MQTGTKKTKQTKTDDKPVPKILQNAAKVGDTIILSRHVHDMDEYDGIFVDGGQEYFRRGGDWKRGDVIDLCITDKLPVEYYADMVVWGTRGKDGTEQFRWVLLKDCATEHLVAIIETQPDVADHVQKAIAFILHRRIVKCVGPSSHAIGKPKTIAILAKRIFNLT